MRILGVDPGLDTTGYGIIETRSSARTKLREGGAREIKFVGSGVIKTQLRCPIFERLNRIYKEVTKVVDEFRPHVLILEKLYSHYRHPTTAILMAHARGVICLVCGETGIPLVSYPATRIKKVITGNGNASKHQVKMMVGNLLRLNNPPECTDISDALALAVAHVYISKVR
jgi:crossover junction endodeoxyribonuclease RuvC